MSQASPSDHTGCDLLLEGGVVLTLDGRRRVVDDGAVAVSGGKIAQVGAAGGMRHLRETAGKVVDCRGKVVLPG